MLPSADVFSTIILRLKLESLSFSFIFGRINFFRFLTTNDYPTQISKVTWLLSLRLLLLLNRLLRSSLPWHWLPQYVHTTRRARLLTLEPRAETVGVEYVCARKLLARRRHVLATNYTNVITWKYKQHVTRKVNLSTSMCITGLQSHLLAFVKLSH